MAQTLLSEGYTPERVKVLRGGWVSWQSLGYPSETSPMPAGTPGAIQIQPGQSGQPIQVVPGGGSQIIIGTPAPAPPSP